MPGFDGTGPLGQGPMTGRRMGYCAGAPAPGYAGPYMRYGSGFGRGRFRGPGWRRGGFWRSGYPQMPAASPQYTREDELADLRAEKELLEREMKALEERIRELEKGR